MRRQQHEIMDRRIVEGQLVDVHRKGLVVLYVDAGDASVELAITDAALRMAADFVSKLYVGRGHRYAVRPGGVGTDREGDVDALFAVRQIDRYRHPVLDRRQLGAQQTDELPVGVVDRERPQCHAEHIIFGRHDIDVGVERCRELNDPDRQPIAFRGRRRADRADECERQTKAATSVSRRAPTSLAEHVRNLHLRPPWRLKLPCLGILSRRRRGRIRNTPSCVFAGTKHHARCFWPEARKCTLGLNEPFSVLSHPELPQRIKA